MNVAFYLTQSVTQSVFPEDEEMGSELKFQTDFMPEAFATAPSQSEAFQCCPYIQSPDHVVSYGSSYGSEFSDAMSMSGCSSCTGNDFYTGGCSRQCCSSPSMRLEATPNSLTNSHSIMQDSNGFRHTVSHMTSHMISESKPAYSPDYVLSEERRPLSECGRGHTHRQASTVREGEFLFSELMTSSSNNTEKNAALSGVSALPSRFINQNLERAKSCTYVRQTKPSTLTSGSFTSKGSFFDERHTPRASPYTSPSGIRRWSIRKRRSYDCNDPDEVTPLTTNQCTHRQHSAGVKYGHDSSPSPGSDRHTMFSLPPLNPQTAMHSPEDVQSLGPCPNEHQEHSELGEYDVGVVHRNRRVAETEIAVLLGGEENSISINVAGNGEEMLRPSRSTLDIPFHSSKSVVDTHTLSKNTHYSSFSSLVKRSHSFGSSLRHLIHRKDGSLSTGSSPHPSPKLKAKQHCSPDSNIDVQNHRTTMSVASIAPLSPAVTYSIGGQDELPHILVDPSITPYLGSVASSLAEAASIHSVILPPPTDFKGSLDCLERVSSQASSSGSDGDEHAEMAREEQPVASFFCKHQGTLYASAGDLIRKDKRSEYNGGGDTRREATLSDEGLDLSSSNDMFSFAEVLACYDNYASETGETTRSLRQAKEVTLGTSSPLPSSSSPLPLSSSPLPPSSTSSCSAQEGGNNQKRNKKIKRHSYTVANIDSDTMREVRQNLARNEEAKDCSGSYVQKVAWEYSQKIKERNKGMRRHSTLFEESSEFTEDVSRIPEPDKPEWLSQLGGRNRRSSMTRMHIDSDMGDEGGAGGIGSSSPYSQRCRDFSASYSQPSMVNGNQSGQQQSLAFADDHGLCAEEGGKKGKLKGWVRSLVAKFGKKDET